jgi:DNA-directed RNA polymerase specialized sigma24 family protein
MPVRTDEPTTGTSPAGSRDPAGDTDGAEDLGGVVELAQRGDPEAFRALYRDIQPRLLRYLHALVGQDAEDVAAETWLHITRDLPAFTGDYDHFRGWTATIAAHVLGKRPGAVRTAAHRGLRTLARHPALTGDRRTRGIPSP